MSDDDSAAAPTPVLNPDDPDVFWVTPTRLLALTDGVVAIAMTLLALDLAPDISGRDIDNSQLWDALRDRSGTYIAFLIAFLLIAQYWIVHHRLLRGVERHDLKLVWANMLFLLGITLLPVTTSLLGQTGTPLAITFYGVDLMLVSVAVGLMNLVIERGNLRRRPISAGRARQGHIRTVTTIAIPVLIIVVAWTVGGNASWLFFLYALQEVPGRLLVRHSAGRAAG